MFLCVCSSPYIYEGKNERTGIQYGRTINNEIKKKMNQDYRFQLDSPKTTGRRQQKAVCPQCGRKSLVRYVDTRNDCCYLSSEVGRCDHEQSCGYHYKPSEYLHDHPWLQESHQPMPYPAPPARPPKPKPIFQPLAPEHVWMQHSPQSTFWQWMTTKAKEKLSLTDADLQRVYEDYQIGATRESDVIFWQIDEDQRVHTGHIMQYGPDGHRLSYNNWEHSRLLKEGRLPREYQVYQCLFGLHLLHRYPDKDICIVESEKTAVLLAALRPEHLWTATCSSGGLTPEKLAPLKGRRIILFPDSGCYGKWLDKMHQTEGLDYVITSRLEQYPPNTDLADVYLGEV